MSALRYKYTGIRTHNIINITPVKLSTVIKAFGTTTEIRYGGIIVSRIDTTRRFQVMAPKSLHIDSWRLSPTPIIDVKIVKIDIM